MNDPLIRFKKHPSPEGFEDLVRASASRVISAAERVLGDRSLAEDVAQEVFVKVLDEDWPGFRVVSGLGLLVSTAIFKAKTLLRSEQRRRAREGRFAESRDTVATVAELSPEERWALHDAIDTLEPSARPLIELHYFGGLAVSEIAIATETSVRTVHDRLRRSRDELAIRLRQSGSLGLLSKFEVSVGADSGSQPGSVAVSESWIEAVCQGVEDRFPIRSSLSASIQKTRRFRFPRASLALVIAGLFGVGLWAIYLAANRTGNLSSNGRPVIHSPGGHGPAQLDSASDRSLARDVSAPNSTRDSKVGAPIESGPSALEIRTVDASGVLCEQGTLFLAVHSDSASALAERIAAQPETAEPFEWLMSPLSLAHHNPLVVDGIPEVFQGIEFTARAVVPGQAACESQFTFRPNSVSRVDLVSGRDPVATKQVGLSESDAPVQIGPRGLFIEVLNDRGELVREGTLELDTGFQLIGLGSDPQVTVELLPFAWLSRPIDLAERNPLFVEELPAALVGVWVETRVSSAAGVADSVRLEVQADEATIAQIVLSTPELRDVLVVDSARGHPIVNALVVNAVEWEKRELGWDRMGESSYCAETDPLGWASIATSADSDRKSAQLRVRAPGYQPRDESFEIGSSGAIEVALAALEQAGSIEVDVLRADGQVRPDIQVWLSLEGDPVPWVVSTDSSGRAKFAGVSVGVHRVSLPLGSLASFGPGAIVRNQAVEVRADQTALTTLGMVGTGRLRVEVVDERGAPQRFVRIGLFGDSVHGDVRTGWGGVAEFESVAAGRYRLIVDRAPRRFPSVLELDVASGEERSLRFVRGSTVVSGRLVGAQIAFANVELIADDGSRQSTSPDSDGMFSVGRVAAGRYLLLATKVGSSRWRQWIEVKSGVALGDLEIPIEPGSALVVTFEPRLEGADVEIRVFDPDGILVTPDAWGGGRWRSGSLAAEGYRVELTRPGQSVTHTVELVAEGSKKLVFDARDLRLLSEDVEP